MAAAAVGAAALSACTPTVKIQAPDRPIEINLHVDVTVSQQVRVTLEPAVQDLIAANPNVF
jgi:hypothetical protein